MGVVDGTQGTQGPEWPLESTGDAQGHINISYSRVIPMFKETNSIQCYQLGFYRKARLFFC